MTELKLRFGLDDVVIAKIISIFKKHTGIEKVVLYGSRAKGNFKPESDIDLTIVSSLVNLSLLFKIENEIDDLLLPYKVDLSVYSMLDNDNLKEHIDHIGIDFYINSQDLKS